MRIHLEDLIRDLAHRESHEERSVVFPLPLEPIGIDQPEIEVFRPGADRVEKLLFLPIQLAPPRSESASYWDGRADVSRIARCLRIVGFEPA